jgi:hypothetical protein
MQDRRGTELKPFCFMEGAINIQAFFRLQFCMYLRIFKEENEKPEKLFCGEKRFFNVGSKKFNASTMSRLIEFSFKKKKPLVRGR